MNTKQQKLDAFSRLLGPFKFSQEKTGERKTDQDFTW